MALGLAPTVASAATSLNVTVGRDFAAGKGHPAADMRFFPSALTVNKGDTLTFHGFFHTATLLPANTDVQDWVDNNASQPGQPDFFLAADSDDSGSPMQLNPTAQWGDNKCSGTETYDGSAVVNSGILLGCIAFSQSGPPTDHGFSVTINANPNTTFWVVCLIHPDMRLKVTVAPSSTPATTQAEIDSATQARVATDKDDATGLWDQLNSRQTSHKVKGGKRVVDAFAGFDTKHLELFGMFPQVLHVHRGQTVRWHFSDINFEPHSVVFPPKTASAISNGPLPQCETSSGDQDATFDPASTSWLPFTCSDGSDPEIELDSRTFPQQGNGKLTSSKDYENSGARGGTDSPVDAPYDLLFPNASPKGGFKYACGIHGREMLGIVKVR
jgi:plastocyanin